MTDNDLFLWIFVLWCFHDLFAWNFLATADRTLKRLTILCLSGKISIFFSQQFNLLNILSVLREVEAFGSAFFFSRRM